MIQYEVFIKHIFRLLRLVSGLVILLLMSCTTATTNTPKPSPQSLSAIPVPEDFRFSLQYGACYYNTIDLYTDTYQLDPDLQPPIPPVALMFSQEEVNRIFDYMLAIDLLAYPTTFAIDTSTYTGSVGTRTPATTYTFTVTYHQQTKTVEWFDNIIQPSSAQANELRDFFTFIITAAEQKPNVQQALSAISIGCA